MARTKKYLKHQPGSGFYKNLKPRTSMTGSYQPGVLQVDQITQEISEQIEQQVHEVIDSATQRLEDLFQQLMSQQAGIKPATEHNGQAQPSDQSSAPANPPLPAAASTPTQQPAISEPTSPHPDSTNHQPIPTPAPQQPQTATAPTAHPPQTNPLPQVSPPPTPASHPPASPASPPAVNSTAGQPSHPQPSQPEAVAAVNPTPAPTPTPAAANQPPAARDMFDSAELENKIKFLESEFKHQLEKEKELKQELETIKEQLKLQKKQLSEELEELRKQFSQPPAAEQNTFSGISQELTKVLKEMGDLVDQGPSSSSADSAAPAEPKPAVDQPAPQATEKTQPVADTKPSDDKTEKEDAPAKASGRFAFLAKRKKLVYLIAGLLLTAGVLAAGWFYMTKPAQVDPELVQQYAPNSPPAEEQSAAPQPDNNSDTTQPAAEASAAEQTQVQGAATQSNDTYAESQVDLPFNQTQWEEHKDPFFGIRLEYPVNTSNLIKTESNMTVLRKEGYILRIQKLQTALEPEEYWKQIKARSLKYKAIPTEFKGYPALKLELEEFAQYPGDRYLVKPTEDLLYDIWYATSSDKLSDDDAKRVDVMLDSIEFLTDEL